MSEFAGKTVLITGASEGIGRATSLAFTARGATVFGAARSQSRLDALVGEAPGPGKVVPIVADVADGPSMEAMTARVRAACGAPDVVIANAGIGLDALFQNLTDDDLRRVFEVNVIGVVRTVRPFVEAMKARGTGRILFISSIVGKRGTPHYSAYSASKFALHGMADSLRVELFGSGVTVGVVCPSSTTTEFSTRMARRGVSQRRFRITRHSAESVAAGILSMAASRKKEKILSLEGKLMSIVDAVAPGIIDRILAKALTAKR
jgi:short-subunit dehydrogenase